MPGFGYRPDMKKAVKIFVGFYRQVCYIFEITLLYFSPKFKK
jgi:hypothetical protein